MRTMLTADYKSPRSAASKPIPANGAHQANGAGGSSSHQLHTPSGTSLKIKRDDLSPVSKFREEQKGMLLSVNTSSSPSPYANVSNYNQHSGARQEIPISVRQSASIYDSQTQPKPRIQSTTTTINKTQFSTAKFNAYSATSSSSNGHHYNNNNYNNAHPAVSHTQCGASSQPYPSSKLDINYTYSEPATNTTTTTRISSFRLGYPDSDEDKIC